MSHSSGIDLSPELIEQFKEINSNGSKRFIKCEIEEELIIIKEIIEGTTNFEEDLDLVLNSLKEGEPSYILFRT